MGAADGDGAGAPADGRRPEAVSVRESAAGRVRRWWRSRGRHSRLRYWLLFRGAPVVVVFLALYVANGLVIGWEEAYDVMLAIRSPVETSNRALAWWLSLASWLVAPGVAGAVAGYVISNGIEARRREPLDRLFVEDDDGWDGR